MIAELQAPGLPTDELLPFALGLPTGEIVLLIACVLVGALVGFGVRHRTKRSIGAIVGGAFEGGIYGGIGAYFGTTAGAVYAELAGPTTMGVALLIVALVPVAGVVFGLLHGDGAVTQKAGGVVLLLLLAGVFVGGAALAFTADDAETFVRYRDGVALGCGLIAGFNGIVVGALGTMHWGLGWLVLPVVSSWGLLGTTLGVLMQFGSWFFYAGWGKRDSAYDYNGLGMIVFANGFRLMPHYSFAMGGAINADNKKMVWHEAVHVLQHVLFGSIYPISYVVWAAVGGLIGAIVGPIRANFAQGVFALAYLNNPWEVWEYRSSWFGVGSNPRQSYDMYRDGRALVWSDGAALGIGILYIVVVLGGWVSWLVVPFVA